jgi:hypothetical protein
MPQAALSPRATSTTAGPAGSTPRYHVVISTDISSPMVGPVVAAKTDEPGSLAEPSSTSIGATQSQAAAGGGLAR